MESEPTNREIQILDLVIGGLTRKEIAYNLGINVKTVEKHISNLRKKLGARNDTHTLLLLLKSGMYELVYELV